MLIAIFSILLFSAVSVAAYAIWSRLAMERDPVAARLHALRMAPQSAGVSYGERPPLFLSLLARLGGFLPAREGRNALRTGLVAAGFRRMDALVLFLGSKVLLAGLLPLVWIIYAFATGRPLGNVVVWVVLLGFAGFYLPSIFLGRVTSSRRDAITRSLPDALDLMVVCVEAGLGMAAALQRVSGEIRLACPALADEFAMVHQEMQTGVSRVESLRNLATRTGVDDIYSLVAMLIQTDRLGTSIGHALRAHAESIRIRRRQRAEQMARKASIKLAFPLVFLVLPALLVIILGPAAIQLVKALMVN